MAGRLVELKRAIDSHEKEDGLEPMLKAADCAVLTLTLPILEPFMHTQTLLEGAKYVTGSLVVPFMYDLRENLDAAIEDLEGLPDSNDADVNTARAAVMPCVVALRKDFVNRWGDGRNILTYREGLRRQPRRFKPVQVLATALHLRFPKDLYGINDEDKPKVWKLVQEETVRIVLQNREQKDSADTRSQSSSVATPPPRAAQGCPVRKRPRDGGFMEAAQAAGSATGQVGRSTDSSTTSLIVNSVRLEVESFQTVESIKMYEPGKDGDESFRVCTSTRWIGGG